LLFAATWRNDIRTFVDPVPSPEYRLKKFSLQTIAMLWCNGTVTLHISLQDRLLGTATHPEECPCNGCPSPSLFEYDLESEWQGYNYSGINTLRLDPGNSVICVAALNLQLLYQSECICCCC
jgi:hypothetical protein